jgi:hypothetical protein
MVSPLELSHIFSWDGVPILKKESFVKEDKWEDDKSRFTSVTYTIKGKNLTTVSRRDKEVDTVWTIEPLVKSFDDVKLFLELPDEIFEENVYIRHMEEEEKKLNDKGIIMVDTEDPVCAVASMFKLEDFTLFALTEKKLCHALLEKHSVYINKRIEKAAKEFPGRLWRIYGPEFITEPFLPPALFEEYVVKYTGPLIQTIKSMADL